MATYKITEETRLKMRLAKLGKKRKPHSIETRLKMSLSSKGKPKSPEHIKKISEYRKLHPNMYWLGKKRPNMDEQHNVNWKGDNVGYSALHKWVSSRLGKPCKCSECGKIGEKRQFHWANISRKYKRELSDWVRLCVSCHKHYDKNLSTNL